MPLLPLNSVGGYSTGITGTAVIDANGNITGVGATFSDLARFTSGISAAGATLANNLIVTPSSVIATSGFTFGSGTTFLAFYAQPSASGGGLWVRDGVFQVGSSTFNNTNAQFYYSPSAEIFSIFGYQRIFNNFEYQAARVPLRIIVGITQSANILSLEKPENTAIAGFNSAGVLFAPGISANGGATFAGNINLQNGESIRNTTDGRIDFMPGPVSGTTYGLYMHFTNWGAGAFGPQFGTVNSSTGVLDQASILYGTDLVITTAKAFSLNNNQTIKWQAHSTATGRNHTLVGTVPVGAGYTGAAVVIIDQSASGAANRAPVVNHSNPNFYVYSAGSANANDFIRFEHDRTNANIVTGQTSGILMQPGSGWLGVSGGISASAGITLSGNITATSAAFTGLISFTAGLSGNGITLSGNLSAATKSFVIPHPTKPHMWLRHGSLEGPENGVYVRGRLHGNNTISLPDYWTGLVDADTITVNLTPIGVCGGVHTVAGISGNAVSVWSETGEINCFFTVFGERKDVDKMMVEF